MASHISFCHECTECNYEFTTKTLKLKKMMVRMHKKVCKKTGRTEKAGVAETLTKKFTMIKKIYGTFGNSSTCTGNMDEDDKAADVDLPPRLDNTH